MRQPPICFYLLVALFAVTPAACSPQEAEPAHLAATTVSPVQTETPGYPGPEPTSIPGAELTPPPEPTWIELTPGEFYAPTPTPAPLFTPQPTPTRRPGSTPTAVTIAEPPDNPAGIIRYATLSEPPYHGVYTHFAIAINAEGQPVGEPEPILLPPELEPYIFQVHPSPDGRYQVLMVTSEPGGIPYLFNPSIEEVRSPCTEPYGGGRFYGWQPGGRHFLFWIDLVGLWLIDAETCEITTLVIPQGLVQGAAISPDGQTIAYFDYNLPDTVGALWLVSIAGSDAEPQVDAGNMPFLHPGAWSPDGNYLIYRGDCPGSSDRNHFTTPLCLFDVQARESRLLELPFAVAYDAPLWSPTGRYILTTGLTTGEQPCDPQRRQEEPIECLFIAQSIYIFDRETTTATALAEGISPIWSPDGSMIAFLSNRSGAVELWTIRADGTYPQQLTSDGQFKSPFGNLSWVQETTLGKRP